MKLNTILEGISYRLSGNKSASDLNILKITDDSNDVGPGSLFIARTGTQSDGRDYIPSAIDKGAIAVFSLPLDESLRSRYPHALFIESDDVKQGMFLLGRNFYRFDRYRLKMIGVTGTDGKTSFTYICESILKALGHKTGIIGTINTRYLDQVMPVANTTPSFLKLHEILSTMDQAGVDYVIMEASSHALDQQRVHGIDFQVAAFTNLKQDHLDYHHDMETYFQAKKQLFTHYCRGCSIINVDDEYGTRLGKELSGAWSVGFSPNAKFRITDCIYGTGITRFQLRTIPVTTNLIGLFNVYNVAQAMVAVHALGFPLTDIAQAVSRSTITVPGRLQKVGSNVYVDYAHTPNALEKAIQSLYKIGWKSVITIFGCGGDRDRTKRPMMGKIAAELSSKCIVTSDNPRSEDPDAIIADIMKGILSSRAIVIPQRTAAIEMGIRMLIDDQTCLLIAGKGHENYQIVGSQILHHDDVETAEQALRQFRRHILILGYGITGKALLDFCRHYHFTATLYDAKPVILTPEHQSIVSQIVDNDTIDSLDFTQFDFIVFSPGVKLPSSLQDEWIHNDRMINEIDFGYLFSSGAIHVVTGTNGKTTTTSLLAYGLQRAGIKAVAAGNIGYPFISAVDSDAEAYSLELSSYQIETLKYLLYDSLIFINLAPDHLDHYPSLDDYYQAKRKIYRHAHAGSITIDGVSSDLCREAKAVADTYDDLFVEQKEHFINPENTSAVVLLWEKLNYPPLALRGFLPPPHRMELIREIHDIKIYNDSKSTNLHSLTNALSLFPDHSDLLLLISGKDKNEAYTPILPLIRQKVRRIYTSGGANQRFAPALESENLEVVRSDRLFESLDKAYASAGPGSVILLSPGLPSFDEFKNFEERGDLFRQKVSQLV